MFLIQSFFCQTSTMEYFTKIVTRYKSLTIFTKHSILDVWQGSEYACVLQYLAIITSIKYLIICVIVKHVVTQRL